MMRQGAAGSRRPSSITDPYAWNCASDPCMRTRSEATTKVWAKLQQETVWINNGRQPQSVGPAIQGYGGHAMFRQSRSQPALETLPAGAYHSLPRLMPKDRDVHPADVVRASMPGYAGHLPGRYT
mmetsp:Transcript_12003/g.17989  ORF Transcript_12003/g.17989 Transcript_12003/m.17989 type:complete len:125 (+) Transcript_12003:968-1342(+)